MSRPTNPIQPFTLATPVDESHPWFGHTLLITEEAKEDPNGVKACIYKPQGAKKAFNRHDLVALETTCPVDMARRITEHRRRITRR